MATHANRRRPSVTWDSNPAYYRIEPLDDSPATPQQPLAHNHAQQLPRSLSGQRPAAAPRAYQQQGSQVPGVLPVPGQYAHPAGSVYPAFPHAQYLAGAAVPAPGASHRLGAHEPPPRSGAGYGYPAQSATTAAPAPTTPSAPLMTNTSLPPTPSQTTPTHSPGPSTSSLDAQPGSPHALSSSSSSSWGTPSPEPDERQQEQGQQLGADLSPRLAQFGLEWDMRDAELSTLPHPPWFAEPAFASRRTACTIAVGVRDRGPEHEWVDVPRRRDGRALTVGDVVGALDAWLWEAVGDDAVVYRPGAADALFYRHRGNEDGGDPKKGTKPTFRNVDHLEDDCSHFAGLDEVPGKNNASTLFLRVKPKTKARA